MRSLTFLKIVIISIVSSCLLCLVAFLALRSFDEVSGSSHRQELAVRVAKEFEGLPAKEAFQNYTLRHQTANGGGGFGSRMQIWEVDAQGVLLGSTTSEGLPFEWDEHCRPNAIHDVAVRYSLFSPSPEFTCVRLDASEARYLAIRLAQRRGARIWGTSFLFIFLTVTIAVFLALTLTFFYLQKKSREAKQVLKRIEMGDLEARFQIQQFDEVGSLMLEFNRMADTLQKLILRVQKVESARRDLLQELGHDIRTPLTSLKTSLETLRHSFGQMQAQDREEFFSVMETELNFLVRLLEDLFFIADLDEPHFKASLHEVDLVEILKNEIRQRMQNSNQRWDLQPMHSPAIVMGDAHMILRLFKNALDNAGRFAQQQVNLKLISQGEYWDLLIDDDGPGLSDQALAEFGQRRQNRRQASHEVAHVSLGLGSVIMKSIAELHRGSVEIQNLSEAGRITGARQKIRLHK